MKIVRNIVMNNLRKALKIFCNKYWQRVIIIGVALAFFRKRLSLSSVQSRQIWKSTVVMEFSNACKIVIISKRLALTEATYYNLR